MDQALFPLHICPAQAADIGQLQLAIALDLLYHGAQRVDMGADGALIFPILAGQGGHHRSLAGAMPFYVKLVQLFGQPPVGTVGKTAGAGYGQQFKQSCFQIRPVLFQNYPSGFYAYLQYSTASAITKLDAFLANSPKWLFSARIYR